MKLKNEISLGGKIIMDMEAIAKLNPMQREAVLHKDGPLLILAGAGSGKTRVLTHRIAYLIEQGVAPFHIMAITFTNKAAKEMRERVDALVEKNAKDIWVSTFHSSCVRILRQNIEKIGYASNFTIYDGDDQEKLIKECYKELNISEKQIPYKSAIAEIGSQKDELISAEEYEKLYQYDFFKSQVSKIYTLYQTRLKRSNSLDFDDLIFKTVQLFSTRPDVLEKYQDKFRYIMVDEYQDTNKSQYELIRRLSLKYGNLCVVGDDDQSIYGWRGANVRNILEFEKDFKNAVAIKLEQNYRSTQSILDAANSVIRNNYTRKNKKLWTENISGNKISICKTENEYEEAFFVADTIETMAKKGISYKSFAILYRTNAQSRVLEDHLVRRSIPYRLFGGVRFYERREIKDALSYLKAINNAADDISIKRIINVPKRGIGDTTIEKITAFSATERISFFDALARVEEISELKNRSKKLTEFTDFIHLMREKAYKIGVVEIMEAVLSETGYLRELELEGTEEAQGRIENLKELVSKAAGYEKEAENPSLSGFLEDVALVADIDNYAEGDETVVLMTLHSAKGLEFPYVFMCGAEEGIFPSYRSITAPDISGLEEERRLCYVGITRAKEKLYISHAISRMMRGISQYNSPSRFLKEIPEELVENINSRRNSSPITAIPEKKKAFVATTSMRNTGSLKTERLLKPVNVTLDFAEGDMVVQPKYGKGKVLQIKDGGADYEITVEFEGLGQKKFMASLSKLQKA